MAASGVRRSRDNASIHTILKLGQTSMPRQCSRTSEPDHDTMAILSHGQRWSTLGKILAFAHATIAVRTAADAGHKPDIIGSFIKHGLILVELEAESTSVFSLNLTRPQVLCVQSSTSFA